MPSSASPGRPSISATAASVAAPRRPASTRSSMPSAASIAPARPPISPHSCATCRAPPRRRAADARRRAARRRRIPPHGGAGPGPRRSQPGFADALGPRRPGPGTCAPSPTRSGRRSARPRFLVEDYVPDRIEFDLDLADRPRSPKAPATVDVAGRFLYGAPAAVSTSKAT